MTTPFAFTIALRDFDLSLLPDTCRTPGTVEFEMAVAAHYASEFGLDGGHAVVALTDDQITVNWVPDSAVDDPVEYGVTLLSSGDLEAGANVLRAAISAEPENPVALYNLGVAESDLGDLANAISHLEHALRIDPESSNTWVALGVALQRNGKVEPALAALRQATLKEPGNGYAHRNLAAVLASSGQNAEAKDHFRQACTLLPSDQATVYGLAMCLSQLGTDEDLAEADDLYLAAIEMDAETDIAERSRKARSRLARRHFDEAAAGSPRMDAVMYCLGALQRYAALPRQDVQNIAFEIAMLGRTGLDVNDPARKYHLRTVPGEFSGLQLVSMMYVAFKQIAPDADVGFDLAREYAEAQGLNQPTKPK